MMGTAVSPATRRLYDAAFPDMDAVAEALGATEKTARARLLHYEHLTWR